MCEQVLRELRIGQHFARDSIDIDRANLTDDAACRRREQCGHAPDGTLTNDQRGRIADEQIADVADQPDRRFALGRDRVDFNCRANGHRDVQPLAQRQAWPG